MTTIESNCSLCPSTDNLSIYLIPNSPDNMGEITLCQTCLSQIEGTEPMDIKHWNCLNDSMWSTDDATKVMAWRLLNRLSNRGELWARDLLEMLYLEPEIQSWAEADNNTNEDDDETTPTKDSNGTTLTDGDSVTLIKDLTVKGAGFTAKRGTTVRNISLTNNPEHIEGKVNGVQIVLVSAFLKKTA